MLTLRKTALHLSDSCVQTETPKKSCFGLRPNSNRPLVSVLDNVNERRLPDTKYIPFQTTSHLNIHVTDGRWG